MEFIRVGIAGLGRLGKLHAKHLSFMVPNCQLVAACSVVSSELVYARDVLGVEHLFSNYEEMVHSSLIDAVFLVTPSGLHCEQIRMAMMAKKHVFSEKPLGLEIADIQATQAIVEAYPNQIFMLGFMRRYDESYQYAKAMIDRGDLGDITLVRCYGIDPAVGLSSFVEFAKSNFSGGLFLDMAIHDIDLIRWLTGVEIEKVWALGINASYPELDTLGELEIGSAMMQLSNRAIALMVAGRNAVHGYHVESEIIGTKGMIRIAQAPEKNLITIMNEHGVVRPCSQNFSERFAQAFIDEAKAFVQAILEKKQPPITTHDGLMATQVALACQKSYEEERVVFISEIK